MVEKNIDIEFKNLQTGQTVQLLMTISRLDYCQLQRELKEIGVEVVGMALPYTPDGAVRTVLLRPGEGE